MGSIMWKKLLSFFGAKGAPGVDQNSQSLGLPKSRNAPQEQVMRDEKMEVIWDCPANSTNEQHDPRPAPQTLAARAVTWTAQQLPDGVLRVAFEGQGGSGSEGNHDGAQMGRAIREALAQYRPRALIIDLSTFEYRFGDWIGTAPILAVRVLGPGRVCVLATGKTAAALRSLWALGLHTLMPLVGQLPDALLHLTGTGGPADTAPPSVETKNGTQAEKWAT
jgi:hypothetical protein